nr:spore coat protein CotJB [uncultured Oscillibacter sp.]
MEKPDTNAPMTPSTPSMPNTSCGVDKGTLPCPCAPLAFPYIPMQENNPVRFSRMEALQTGTLFPGLDLPFKAAIQAKTKLANTALVELMALDFAIDELGLYLVTHSQDQEALQLYWSYIKLAQEGREKYQKMYGPLLQTDLTPEEGYAWLKDPWPWDEGGND